MMPFPSQMAATPEAGQSSALKKRKSLAETPPETLNKGTPEPFLPPASKKAKVADGPTPSRRIERSLKVAKKA